MLSDKDERQLREQLDGEQKLSKHWYSEFRKLRKQLDAERITELQQQLAVAREALEEVVNWFDAISELGEGKWLN